MKPTLAVVLLLATSSANAGTFNETPWCNTVLKYVMRGFDAAHNKKKTVESIIAIPSQQERLLALQGWRAAKDGVTKAQAYVYFMTQCLSANSKNDEADEKESF